MFTICTDVSRVSLLELGGDVAGEATTLLGWFRRMLPPKLFLNVLTYVLLELSD